MASEFIDEHEQGERARKWLQKNGASLVTGILLGFAAIAGWQWWNAQGEKHLVEAAEQFGRLEVAISEDRNDQAEAIYTVLLEQFSDTPYVTLAAAIRAADRGEVNELAEALKLLEDGLKPSSQLISLRIAKLHLQLESPDQALLALERVTAPAYEGLREELRGDAYRVKNDLPASREAYEKALAKLDAASPVRFIVELKFAEVGGHPSSEI